MQILMRAILPLDQAWSIDSSLQLDGVEPRRKNGVGKHNSLITRNGYEYEGRAFAKIEKNLNNSMTHNGIQQLVHAIMRFC